MTPTHTLNLRFQPTPEEEKYLPALQYLMKTFVGPVPESHRGFQKYLEKESPKLARMFRVEELGMVYRAG